MNIAIACDHGGFALKNMLTDFLAQKGFKIIDEGTFSCDSVDYPDYAQKVCKLVMTKKADKGILICGSGVGMSISANKFKNIRAALCNDLYTAKYSRLHNDANVLCLGARVIGEGLAFDIVMTWLKTDYEGGRHDNRVKKMMDL